MLKLRCDERCVGLRCDALRGVSVLQVEGSPHRNALRRVSLSPPRLTAPKVNNISKVMSVWIVKGRHQSRSESATSPAWRGGTAGAGGALFTHHPWQHVHYPPVDSCCLRRETALQAGAVAAVRRRPCSKESHISCSTMP
jgi:hypothetical protein